MHDKVTSVWATLRRMQGKGLIRSVIAQKSTHIVPARKLVQNVSPEKEMTPCMNKLHGRKSVQWYLYDVVPCIIYFRQCRSGLCYYVCCTQKLPNVLDDRSRADQLIREWLISPNGLGVFAMHILFVDMWTCKKTQVNTINKTTNSQDRVKI